MSVHLPTHQPTHMPIHVFAPFLSTLLPIPASRVIYFTLSTKLCFHPKSKPAYCKQKSNTHAWPTCLSNCLLPACPYACHLPASCQPACSYACLPTCHSRSSSIEYYLPSKVIFHQRSSSITGSLPTKVFFH